MVSANIFYNPRYPYILNYESAIMLLHYASAAARAGSLTPENLASLMAAYFFVKFRNFLVRNSVIYDIIRLYHLS